MHKDDISLRGIGVFLGALVLVVVLSYLAINGMAARFESAARRRDVNAIPAPAASLSRPYFPLPREQPQPRVDLEEFRTREEAELNSYGWINRTAGVVRIPIDRAINLIVEKQGAK